MIKFIAFVAGMVITGAVFGTIARIPTIKRHAIQSHFIRRLLTFSLSVLVFIPFMLVFSLFFASMSQIGYYSHGENEPRYVELDNELWIHFIALPILIPNDKYFSNNDDVCEIALRILHNERNMTGYIITLILTLIPTLSCTFMVHYLARDNRKEKVKKCL